MTCRFNLIDDPWIPCVTLDGVPLELGLRSLLLKASELARISAETPLLTTAIYPLVLALLHRTLGPKDTDDWARLHQSGEFPIDRIDPYLDQWRDRFELFHPTRPFYQMRDSRVRPKSVLHLVHSIGNTGTLFSHENEEHGIDLTPAEAARRLVAAQGFRTAGLSGLAGDTFTDGPLTRGALFWANGRSVFETLLLNLPPYPAYFETTRPALDRPAWEVDDPFLPKRNAPLGHLDYLTWQSNRIWLMPEATATGCVVRTMTIAPGMRLDAVVKSPHKHYVKKSKKLKDGEDPYSFLYLSAERALWRDYRTLVALDDEAARPPMVVEWLAQLVVNGVLPTEQGFMVQVSGMLADQAKPIFYRQEALPLPKAVLTGAARTAVEHAMNQAEAVSDVLNKALWRLATDVLQRAGEPSIDKDAINRLKKHWDAEAVYWSNLEPEFWSFVNGLSVNDKQANRLSLGTWLAQLQQAAFDALHHAARLAGHDVGALKGRASAEKQLRAQFASWNQKEKPQ